MYKMFRLIYYLTEFLFLQSISACAIFLAAKVEEQPRKLEHVIKVAHMCLHRDSPALDIKSEVSSSLPKQFLFFNGK